MQDPHPFAAFLDRVAPFGLLPAEVLDQTADALVPLQAAPGAELFAAGQALAGLYLIRAGTVEIVEPAGAVVSHLGPGAAFGERGLLRDGHAAALARCPGGADLLLLPAAVFLDLIDRFPGFARFFSRRRPAAERGVLQEPALMRVAALMAAPACTIAPQASLQQAAQAMQAGGVSSLAVVGAAGLEGILTTRDLACRVLAPGLDPGLPVARAMTPAPLSLPPSARGADVLRLMLDHGIGHVPVVQEGRLLGMVTQTDLTRRLAAGPADLIRAASAADSPAALAAITARLPAMLAHLVAAHAEHEVTTRLLTDVADAATRRLIALAETRLGPAPVPWVWLACGSQGRQEQTGVTDQDNALMICDSASDADMGWFAQMAVLVCQGLADCGYVLCPGQMMAMTPRWRLRQSAWRACFQGWVMQPDPQAVMLSAVMFDLRAVAGDDRLFTALQAEALAMAADSPAFVAQMLHLGLGHAPPLGLLRGIATQRSGAHRNQIDLKMSGVVPVVDLARVYALLGRIGQANSRERIEAAGALGVISAQGARDLTEAYDLIAETRLAHQARLIREGQPPDNWLSPHDLSDFERSHLREAFLVVRSMQSALAGTRGLRI